MGLDNYVSKFNELEEKGINEGLTYKDYKELSSMLKYLNKNGINNDKAKELYENVNKTINYMRTNGVINKFSSKNRDYIKENSLLLPLIVEDTQGEIRMTGNNTFTFNCIFHDDEHNDLFLKDVNNRFACCTCKERGDIIDYVMKFHHFNRVGEALEFLCKVFKYELPSNLKSVNNPDIEYLANGYIDVFQDDICIDLMNQAEERLYSKGIYEMYGQRVEDIYNKRRDTILRVREGVYDPNFKYDKPKKYVKLKKQK